MLNIYPRSKQRKRSEKIYPKEIEAAYYALKEFISPLECNERYDGTPLPKNLQVVLQHYMSGTKFTGTMPSGIIVPFQLQVFYFSKQHLFDHLFGDKIYYYRSKQRQLHYTGHGNSDKQAQNLPFSKGLNISTKRKLSRNDYYVVLCGIDVDAHKPEQTDAEEVKNWLNQNYFKESYWEKSTSFRGGHGYYKLGYPKYMKLEDVDLILKEVHTLLDLKRKKLGYLCEIDIPCGLPTIHTYFPDRSTLSIDISEFIPDFHKELRSIDMDIFSNYLYFSGIDSPEINKLESYETRVDIKSSQCFKIPRFNSTEISKCNMEDIQFFHNLEFYDISYFIRLRAQLRKELNIKEHKETDASVFSSEKKNTSVFNTSGLYREEMRDNTLPIVCATFSGEHKKIINYPEYIKWEDVERYNTNKVKYEDVKKNDKKLSYSEKIEICRCVSSKVLRTNRLCWALTLKNGEIPSLDDAIDEYVKHGLNSNPDRNSSKRKKRFRATLNLIKRKFDKNKLGLHLSDWRDYKIEIIKEVSKVFSPELLQYNIKKDKTLKIKPEEIAFIYYVIYQSNLSDKNKSDSGHKYAISYDQFKNAMVEVFGCPKKKLGGYSRHKLSKILQLLQNHKIIIKDDTYIKGYRGNCYKILKNLINEK